MSRICWSLFFYIQRWEIEYIPYCKGFLLDSGAFSFLNQNRQTNFDQYLYRYIDFINRHEVEQFFELDVDAVVGLKKVEEYRQILERETGKKCIPVWHRSRGKPYFLDLVQEYDRVALGGLAIKTIQTHEYKYLPWFVETAHRHHAKIHGLGFSSTRHLPWIPFDSVDSTSCWSGGRFGTVYQFDGKSIRKVAKSGELGMRARLDEVEMHNVKEWIKYVHYLDQKY